MVIKGNLLGYTYCGSALKSCPDTKPGSIGVFPQPEKPAFLLCCSYGMTKVVPFQNIKRETANVFHLSDNIFPR
jgi:hypothetical protein